MICSIQFPLFDNFDTQIKYQLLERLRIKMTEPNVIKNSKLKLTFCARGIEPPKATSQLLPILVDACPEKFSTVDYFIVSNIQPFCTFHQIAHFPDIKHGKNRSFGYLLSDYDIVDGRSVERYIRSRFGGNSSEANIW